MIRPTKRRNLRQADQRVKSRRGAMLVLLAAMLVIFFVAVAFSVDIAYMHLVRGELRAATDAATKAASETLSRTQDINLAVARGQEIARENLVAGRGLELDRSDFKFGNSKQLANDRFDFRENARPINSVEVRGRRTATSRSGPVGLFFGGLLGTRTFAPEEVARTTFVERDLVIVVDRSGSMFGQKFADLQRAIQTFVVTLKAANLQTRVGLASYSTFASEDVQLTADLDQTTLAMSRMPVAGFTSISRGMEAGANIMRLSRSGEIVERTMIVMTDGLHNAGPEPEPIAIALASQGIVIHTVGFGSDADFGRMQRMAQIGNGRSFQANDGTQLNRAFRELALTLSTVITE
ncbi:MAG: VWA domain-containing protein [Pirellulaceae bacterium]|nr:VWA domain-containing protein [Pirellulaceae bacterium]